MAGKSRILNHVEVSPVTAGEARKVGCNMICFGRQGGHVADNELSLGRYGILSSVSLDLGVIGSGRQGIIGCRMAI